MDTTDPVTAPQPGAQVATGGATGATTPPTLPAAPPAAGEPAGSVDYERKFKGLQAAYQQLQTQLTAAISDKDTFATQIREMQAQIAVLQDRLTTLQGERDQHADDAAAALAELAEYKIWERKMARIRTIAPHLAQFERFITVEIADDLMDDPSQLSADQQKALDAALDQAIGEFSQSVGQYVDGLVKAQFAGVVPTTSPGKGAAESKPLDLEALYTLAMSKAGTPEFEPLMKKYAEAAKEQQGAVDGMGYWRPHTITLEMP